MAAALSKETTDQAAAAAASYNGNNARRPAAKLLHPQLLMAARRGDSKRLKELLGLNKDDESGMLPQVPKQDETAVVVEVDRRRPSAPPAAQPLPLLERDGVTPGEGDSLLHVVAASGDSQEFLDCATIIHEHVGNKGLLGARNNKGDTPLHCAAGAGNARMISCLIDLIPSTADEEAAGGAAAKKKALVRTQNECGETALHQAVCAARNKVVCIDQLLSVDPELACIPHEDGASPLYLAVSLGEVEIAEHLYVKSEGNKLSYSGPDGRNVLHAAVYRGQGLPMILEWLQDVKTMSCGSSVAAAPDLLSQLTSQRDRLHKGITPLYLAASLDWSLTEQLLDANESTAYQADDEGSYPIHVAAWSGRLGVVELLLKRSPDCATLRDGKGRTFLHVAAEKECHAVVEYVCGEMPNHLSRMILNAQDSNGDTALHGAVRAGNLAVFNCLFRNRQVRLDVANQDGMTPLDLSWTMIPAGKLNYGYNPRSIVRESLRAAGAPRVGGRLELFTFFLISQELFTGKHFPKIDIDKESKKHTEATQVMSIVTALIATVTFASAFTLPGGYRSADDAAGAAGTPVLAGTYAFDAFILADTMAFICSMLATCVLVYAGFPAVDISIRSSYLAISVVLLRTAARSLVAAFGLGLYLVVHHSTSGIAACAIVFASSFFGHVEVGRIIRMATTVRARIGISRRAAVTCATAIFYHILFHFGAFVIIFGLPAISNWVIPAIRKWVHQKKP